MSVALTLTPPVVTHFHEKDLLNVLAEIQLNPPTQQALAHAQSVIADTAVDATFREHILEEITTLSATVLKIEADFASISLSIREIDDKKALRDEKGVLIELLPEWISYHEVRSLSCSGFRWLFFQSSNRRIQACYSHLRQQLRR
jgi:hypothetical protein